MPLKQTLSRHWFRFQRELFPWLEEALGPLGERYQRLVRVVELVRAGGVAALQQGLLRRLVAGAERGDLLSPPLRNSPRAMPGRLHEALLDRTLKGHLAGHVSRDSTAIGGRESPAPKPAPTAKPKRRRGRPRQDEPRPKEPRRLERQASMTLEQMLEDLPKVCDIGVKRNAKGHQESWTGYKLHIDAIDGGIPVSCLLTSASVHDSQAAIPLARLTASRVDSLYDLMDSAYDAVEIRAFSQKLGHVPIIDLNPRRRPQVKAERKREALAQRRIGQVSPEARRTRERSTVERVNGRLKDEFGGRYLRVRGPGKVLCHLMFGILALTVEQLMRLTL